MAAIQATAPVEMRGEEQVLVIQPGEEDLDMMPRSLTKGKQADDDLSSMADASAANTTTAIVLAVVESKFFNWERSVLMGRMWLRSVIDYFGQQFDNYISGVSEKMEKLEYY
ncbi:unnamed protein product [Calypogeia fissa]